MAQLEEDGFSLVPPIRRDLGNARASTLRPGGQEWFKDEFILVPPMQWRYLLVTSYRGGMKSWGQVYKELFNGGWRGPMDQDGFPTRHAKS